MKKLCIALLCAISFTAAARADEISEIREACTGIADQIRSVQVLAGVSTGASIGGTLANTTAFVSGLMKSAHDKTLAQLEMEIEAIEKMNHEEVLWLVGEIGRLHELEKKEQELSQKMGNVRTIGLGVGTATGGVSAITSGIGAKQVGELAGQMDRCNRAIDGIKRLSMEKSVSGEPDEIANFIAANCRKLDPGNMETIHKQMVASAVVSGVGAAASLTGAVTSAIAVNKEKKNNADATGTITGRESTKTLNTVANVSAGVGMAASVGSIALGAVVLSKLNKDSENARACEEIL